MPNINDDIQLRSEEVQEILTRIPHGLIRWGNLLFLSLILMLLGMAWMVKYPDIIYTEALITTPIPPQKEFAKITGKLQKILVKDGEDVIENQALAVIENSANYVDVFSLKAVMDTVRINKNAFNFPIDQLPMLFLGDIEFNYALFENNYLQYRLNKKWQPFSNEALANKFSITELKNQLQSLNAQKELNESELKFKQRDLKRQKELFEIGAISALDYETGQLEYLQAERNLKNYDVSISQINESISNSKKLSVGTEINRAKEEMVLLKSVIQSFNQLKKSIKDWEQTYILKSDIAGKVAFLNYWTEHQRVNQGDLIFTTIPTQETSFLARLIAPVRNSGKIKIGQKVNIKLERYPEEEFGTLKGEVQKISIFPNEDGRYLVDVTLPNELKTSYNKQIPFKQEMSGSAEIITENLRLIDRFFYQFKGLFK